MPGRARKPQVELEYGVYKDKPPTDLQERFAQWLIDNTGYKPGERESFNEGVRLATILRMQFQASPENKEANAQRRAKKQEALEARRAAREEAKQAKVAAREEKATAKVPAKATARKPAPKAAAKATAKPTTVKAKPRKRTAASTADF